MLTSTCFTTCQQDILQDITCNKIAEYLKYKLNAANPLEGLVIVNSTRSYDAFSVPVQDFPLLKVYRNSTQYRPSQVRQSRLTAQYGLILPDQERLLPLLNWVDDQISRALSYIKQDINVFVDQASKSCDYRTLSNELGTPVYSFLRFNFVVTEGNC